MKKPSEGMSKAQGMAKQVKAKLSGDHGILNRLAKEHGEVSGLMSRIEASKDDSNGADTRRDLFEKMVVELLSHAHVEERLLYAALERYPESQGKMKDARHEHHEMERIIADLDGISYSSPAWMTRFSELKELVLHHVEEEEGEIFEITKDVMSKDELQALDERYLEERQQEKEQLMGRAGIPGEAGGEASPPPAAP